MYVVMSQVMRRANISDPEEFRTVAEYLEEREWIAEADPDYGVFVLTPKALTRPRTRGDVAACGPLWHCRENPWTGLDSRQ